MLSWEFPPKIIGGLGVVVYDLSKALLRKNIEVNIVLPFNPKNNEEIFRNRIVSLSEDMEFNFGVYDSIRFIGESIKGEDFIKSIEKYTQRCVEICRYMDFDIIHAHDWLTYNAAMKLKEITGKPFIAHVHSTEFDRAGGGCGNPLVHDIEYRGLKAADKIIAVSGLVKRWIVEKYGIDENKIEVVHNAIEINPAIYMNGTGNPQPKKGKLVLYVGRLSWMKGVDYFLRVAKKVLEKEDAYFVIIGTGELLPQLIEEACNLGIADRVLFTGFVDRERIINEYYKIADVLVIPSRSEPFGLIALEGAINGVPIVISKQSGVSEVLNHTLKVDFWDVNEMANKILALLRYEPLKRMISKNVVREVVRLTWDKQSQKIVNIYNEVMRGR